MTPAIRVDRWIEYDLREEATGEKHSEADRAALQDMWLVEPLSLISQLVE